MNSASGTEGCLREVMGRLLVNPPEARLLRRRL